MRGERGINFSDIFKEKFVMVLHLSLFIFLQHNVWAEMSGLPLLDGDGVSLCHPGWSAVAPSLLIATSALRVQAIFLPQPPE